MDRNARQFKSGFTLIEVMVAMVIMSVGLLAVLKMAYVYVQTNTQNLQRGQSSVRTQDKMEQLRSYAVSDRVDKFSVFDFDYLVSTNPAFTTVWDPSTSTDIAVPGLLSGSAGGTPVTTSWGVTYEVLNDSGNNGDASASDGTYSGSDTQVDAATSQTIQRLFTVTPFPAGAARPSYATIEVTTSWTDKAGIHHDVHLKSVVNRRQ